ncbi:hypothetical protein K8S19_08945 [bacterium]|nr:hypothetical protein [bacterium]
MISNRYLAILAGNHHRDNPERKFYSAVFNYLDDRNWPVTVWRHCKKNKWVQRSSVFATLYYGVLLCLTLRSTLVVEACLLDSIAGALLLAKKIVRHDVIISITRGRYFVPRKRGLRRLAIEAAHLVIVDSEETRQQLLEDGLGGKWVRVLPAAQEFALLHDQASEIGDGSEPAMTFEPGPVVPSPGTLVEAIEQLDMKSSLQYSNSRWFN